MIAPLSNIRITCPFGWRIHPITGKRQFHNGIDVAAPLGTPIVAPFDGVCQTLTHPSGGVQLIIRHSGGLRVGFAHLSRYAEGIRTGSRVREGQVIAYSGESGAVTGPHVHMTTAVEKGTGRQFFDPTIINWPKG